MRMRSIMLNLLTVPLIAQVSAVTNSDSKDVVPAFDSTGAITLPAARRKVDLVYPHGKKDRRELTVVYDPRTGHYLWHLTSSNPNIDDTGVYLKVIKKQEAVAYADPAGLIDFIFGNGLSAKVWQGTHGTHGDRRDVSPIGRQGKAPLLICHWALCEPENGISPQR